MAERWPTPLSDDELLSLADELRELGAIARARRSGDDVAKLRKLRRQSNAMLAVGVATLHRRTLGVGPVLLSLGRNTRWILMHHIGHGAYDAIDSAPPWAHRSAFARGRRRLWDWPDWMRAEPWIYEHNHLHHAHTGHDDDPDVLERNTEALASLPMPIRLAAVALLSTTWRIGYYPRATEAAWAERTQRPLRRRDRLRHLAPFGAATALTAFGLTRLLGRPGSTVRVLTNLMAAEALTNLHSFVVVSANHTGADLPRFDGPPRTGHDRLVRQIEGTANYTTPAAVRPQVAEVLDHLHLWLNFQIEHHLFPDLPPHRYREIQPEVKRLCAEYGVRYHESSVATRLLLTVRNVVGLDRMQRRPAGPAEA